MGLGWDGFTDFHFKSLVGEDAILATFDLPVSNDEGNYAPKVFADDKGCGLGRRT